jgi:hypothetical protein
MIQDDAIPRSVSWSPVRRGEYQLRGEGRVLATLEMKDELDASMTREGESRRWTFKRTGILGFTVSVLDEYAGEDCAMLVEGRTGEYQISFSGGPSPRWKQIQTRWREEGGLVDSTGNALITFAPQVAEAGYRASVRVTAAGRALPNLDLCCWAGIFGSSRLKTRRASRP